MINNPKVVCFDWLKIQKLDNVRRLLKDQSLRKFLELKGNIYPDLIRVFYTNLKFEGNNLVSHVKGVEMEITMRYGLLLLVLSSLVSESTRGTLE